jgi:hypothetical protein
MLIGAGSFIGQLACYRLCWLRGKFSGGKTSFAYRMAYEFLKRGYRLATNNLCVWADDLRQVELDPETGHLKAFVVLDEGGLAFKANAQIEEIAAFAAKMDCVYLIPSFFAPTRAARVITCQALFSLKPTGIPLIVYRWDAKEGSFHDGGFFFWWAPSEIYGVYSRQDPGSDSSELVDFLSYRTQEYKARFESRREKLWERPDGKDGISEVERKRGEIDLTTAILADAAGEIGDAASELSTVSFRRRRRWRRQL